jgi:cellulose synthase/poly-beta-1,6-N-acetylglucosamine synthase-like glycosyltransferase
MMLVTLINWLTLSYFLILSVVYFFTSVLAYRHLKRYSHKLYASPDATLISAQYLPPVTIIGPAYNEEATCVDATRSLLTMEYPNYEVLVVNDGSKDSTLERMIEAFDMEATPRMPLAKIPTKPVKCVYRSKRVPNLWLIDKENGGKADSLNAGINFSTAPFFCAMDADSLLERTALIRIVRPFIENATTVAVGGIIRIVNGCTVDDGRVSNIRMPHNIWAKFQVLEYFRAFLAGRMGWEAMRATLIISGAFGLFRRSTVVDVGGYATKSTSRETVGEDMELVVRLHKHCLANNIPYTINFIPDPVAWTECPESPKILKRQRSRWQKGLLECTTRHADMLFNPRYGRIGMVAFPYFLILEGLGPVVEFLGYAYFIWLLCTAGTGSSLFIVAFFLVAFVLGMSLSVLAICLEEISFRRYPRFADLVQLFLLSIAEVFGYRQLNAWWRMNGLYSFLTGNSDWGKMERKGFSKGGPSKK